MKPFKHLLPPSVGLLMLMTAPAAHASATFPSAVQSKLGLAHVPEPSPGCRLCHQTDAGGLKTATQPFGRAVLRAGAVGGSVPSLLDALDILQDQRTDSDFDGVSDIDELKAGTDPNTRPAPSEMPQMPDMPEMPNQGTIPDPRPVPLPQTGCTLSGRPTPGGSTLASVLLLGLAARRSQRRARNNPQLRG